MVNSTLQSMLGWEFAGNSVYAYGVSVIIFITTLLILYFFKRVVIVKLKKLSLKTKTDIDDFIIGLLDQIRRPVYVLIAFFLASRRLSLSQSVDKVIVSVLIIALVFKGIKILQAIVAYFVEKMYLGPDAKLDKSGARATRSLTTALNWVIWAGGAVFLLDNLGIKISAVIAGLGIGGVAVALAAQSILGDLFSSFAIFLDKPFKIGDFIIVGDLLGVVEHVGIKTTRIRSLWGEQLVFPNSDLTNSRIRNYKKMQKRRVSFKIGVVYQTTHDQLKKIPRIVTEIVKNVDKATLDRVHFLSFADFSLVFEIVYYVDGSDYNLYMDIQQEINLALKENFEKAGIEFAYPTQTLYTIKSDSCKENNKA